MDWRTKGTIQKLLGWLPGGSALHYQLQVRFGGMQDFDAAVKGKVEDWQIMATFLRQAGVGFQDARLLEIGTGWYPTFPFACYLAGARSVASYDLNRLMQPVLMRDCARRLAVHLDTMAEASGTDPALMRARHARLVQAIDAGADLESATDGVVRYQAPADATRTGLADGEIDVVFSNSVLEHVPPAVIAAMYRESLRILRPGGSMFHSVNCGDHYAYVDRRVNQLNYLRYSDRQWRFWNNSFLYQNRMRAHEFVDVARGLGYEIVLDSAITREHRLKELAAMPVHPQFAHVPPEKLCITSVDMIARKPATA